ncbi:MAG: protein kinase [Bryobacteraceae bacterium]|nr:protein kinase [Bryobacteraceae bacterium]
MLPPSQRFEQVEDVFLSAVELAPEQRGPFLEQACGSDVWLRQEVESLLAHEHKSESIFAHAVSSAADTVNGESPRETPTHVGPWCLIRLLGTGGMGSVWLASRDDDEFQRKVAVKFLRRNLFGGWALRRFRHERQILAGLQHPNIASFYDGGTSGDGQPYIVMEYVEGPCITTYCRDNSLPAEERIRLFQRVCSAVGYAHQNLIIHRDLKPSNILVHHDGQPKLLDFGIAKLTDPSASDAGLTQTGLRLLTPDYASPEQVRGDAVTTATDVYSLGLILYEMLTGQQAQGHTNGSQLELEKSICETMPRTPSTVVLAGKAGGVAPSALKGDLDNIVLKAIRKEPERRYGSVSQFSEDLDCFLETRPVSARRDTLGYRVSKFLRRNSLLSATATVALLSLIGGITVALYQATEARRQAEQAEHRFAQVRKLANTFLFDFHDKIQDLPGSTPARQMVASTALSYLDSLAADSGGNVELRREVAQAYEKVGDVLGLPGSSNLGNWKDAKSSYSRALSIAESFPENQLILSRLTLRLGMVEAVTGNSAKALEQERRAAALAEEAERFNPSSAARRQIIAVNGQLGSQLVSAGRLEEGTTMLLRALAVEQQESTGSDVGSLLRVAVAHSKVASALKMSNDRNQTLTHLQRAQTLAERALALDPENSRTLNLLINVHRDRADAISSPFTPPGMDWPGALASYRAAHGIAVKLFKTDPANGNAAYQVLLAQASIADALRETDPERALPAMDLVKEDWKRYSHLNTNSQIAERMLLNIHLAGGRIRSGLGEQRRAEEEFNGARAIADLLYRKDPKRFTLLTDRLSIHTYRGVARMRSGQTAQAEKDFTACRELAGKMSVASARARELREAAYCFEYSGDLAYTHRLPVARAHYDAALGEWKAILAKGHKSPYLDSHIASISTKLRRAGGTP